MDESQPITKIAFAELRRLCGIVAAGAVLLRYSPRTHGGRGRSAMALAGMLLRCGFSVEDAQQFVNILGHHAGNPPDGFASRAERAQSAIDHGDKVTGWPTLKELLGAGIAIERVPKWLGHKETNGSGPLLDPHEPLMSARVFIAHRYLIDEILTLQHQAQVYYNYQPQLNAYQQRDDAAVRAEMYMFLESAKMEVEIKGEMVEVPFQPNRTKVDNVLDALRAVCHLPKEKQAPCWLNDDDDFDPLDLIVVRNGLLHIPTRELLSATPKFFSMNPLEFDFDPNAGEPEEWLKFLDQLWGKDFESIQTVQEWLGLLITTRMHFQKMLLIIGPQRSGKGTIIKTAQELLGARNVCKPTLNSLGIHFGAECLIGKTAAFITDARIGGKCDTSVLAERLLSISGQDNPDLPRKNMTDWREQVTFAL